MEDLLEIQTNPNSKMDSLDGWRHPNPEPTVPCPYCQTPCRADWVDVGVGVDMQCGPYHCDLCYASQIGPYDKVRELTEAEKETGWYAPGEPAGSSANSIGGRVVGHAQADAVYRASCGVKPRGPSRSEESHTPTRYRVACPKHGPVFISKAGYDRQMASPNDGWKCPACSLPAIWDDAWYDSHEVGF